MAVKINLLDWRTELATLRKQQFVAAILGGVMFAVAAVGAMTYGVSDAIDFQRQRNEFLRGQIAEMDKKIKEIEELEKVKANLLARMKVIEELQSSRTAMVHFFDEILNTLPDGVYIKQLRQSGAAVTIEGVAESNGRVSSYMKNIEASAWFADPKLVVINTKDTGRKRQAEFQLTFKNLTKQKPGAAADGEDAQ